MTQNKRPLHTLSRSIVLLVAVVYVISVYSAWQRTLSNTETNLSQINSMLAQGVRSTLKAHELILRGFGEELIARGALESPEAGREFIEHMHTIDPGIAGFGLARPDGQLMLISTVKQGVPLPNLMEMPESRDSFKEVLESRHLRTGRPYFFKPLNTWLVPIRSPVFDKNGKLIAVMAAAYKMDSDSVSWSNAELPAETALALMRDDGYLIFRQPLLPGGGVQSYEMAYGSPVAESTIRLVKSLDKEKSFLTFYAPDTDTNYYFFYSSITEYGIHAGAFISQKAVILNWLQRIIAPTILVFLFMIAGGWAFRRASQTQARADEELMFQARHDSLTGLPNRTSLHEAFEAGAKAKYQQDNHQALLLIDLDRFKEVNDTLGHHIGDQVLKQIGLRLNQCCAGNKSMTARLGGDEFAVLLEMEASCDAVVKVAINILKELSEPLPISGIKLRIGASIGIACYPQHGKDSHELLRAADVAMYKAKRLAVGVMLYDESFDGYSTQRLRFANELTQAVAKKQLVLHYQPKINIASGEIVSFEALVRWQHPTEGLLFPDAFIDLVEMSEVVHAFTHAVIELAITEKKKLKASGYKQPVAINLSAHNLLDDSCLNFLKECLEKNEISPSEVELELTESAVMHDPERGIAILDEFKAMGINIAIDDFGKGYSSLDYLRKLPVVALKIDRDFVIDMIDSVQDSTIVQSIIALAHSLNLEVIAEGVENDVILAALASMNCDMAQGYGICRPKPLTELIDWLSS